MHDDERAVRTACEEFGRAMKAMDFAALDDLWDRDNEHFVYQPEEFEQPCRSWEEFHDYLSYIPKALDEVLEWRELRTDVAIMGDTAVVFSAVHLSFDFTGVDEPFAGDVRFTYVLRRTPDGWRFFHCHESRQLVLDTEKG